MIMDYQVIDRSADRAKIAARIDRDEQDREYAEWRERAGLPDDA